MLVVALAVARVGAADGDDDDRDSAYGARGSVELGGSASLIWAANGFAAAARPSFGVFVADLVELSAIFDVAYARDEPDAGRPTSAWRAVLVLEPSYHPRVSDDLFLLAGLGLGLRYNGDRFDVDVIPRAGVNLVVGDSAVVTPAIRFPIALGARDFVGTIVEIGLTTTW